MRAIKIDPFKRDVTEIDIAFTGNDDDYRLIQKAIDANAFETIIFRDANLCLYCDGNGNFRDKQAWFQFGNSQPLTGLVVVLGTKPNSNKDWDIPERIKGVDAVEFVSSRVKWLDAL